MKSQIHEHRKNNFKMVSKNLFLALLLVTGITATAQDKKERKFEGKQLTSEQKVDLQVKKMTKELALNEKQAAEVRTLVTKQVAKREATKEEIKAKKAQKREAAKAKIQEDEAALSADMKKILTPEQFTKWEKIRKEKIANMKEKMSERRGKPELKPLEEDK